MASLLEPFMINMFLQILQIYMNEIRDYLAYHVIATQFLCFLIATQFVIATQANTNFILKIRYMK